MNVTTGSYEILFDQDQIHFCDDVVVSTKGDVYIADASKFRVQRPEAIIEACSCSVLHVIDFLLDLKLSLWCVGWEEWSIIEILTIDWSSRSLMG